MRNKLGGFLLIVVMATALLGGWLGDRVAAGGPPDDDLDTLLRTFTEAFAKIQTQYAEDVESDQLMESAIRGMLRTLDPHSSYFAASDYSQLQEEQQGQYFGLGILIRPERPGSGRVVIVEPPAPGTPGYKMGLRPGDVISKIGGESIDEWEYPNEIIPRLKGPKGTKVNITIERPGEGKPIVMDVERDAIPLYTIKHWFFLAPQVGYIRIDRFSESTSGELDDALAKLDEPTLKSLILDLRNNPGGSLRQAIEVSDRFLKKGQVIVTTRNRDGSERKLRAPHKRKHLYPMVVLINRHSASASEIVSGALQDHDRALIVGETSFGKALVQTVFPLGERRGLALTTGRYYTPSNRLIQRPYDDGFYDYLYSRPDVAKSERKAYLTDGGRTVFGGGGIMPDVEEEIARFTRFASTVNRKNLFYKFAGMLTRGEVQSDIRFKYSLEEMRSRSETELEALQEKLQVTETGRTMELFKEFLNKEGLEFTEEEFDESRRLLANRLRQEIFLGLFGERDGAKIQLKIDNQVQKAIELLPKAQALLDQASQQ